MDREPMTQQQTERERLADDLEKICAGEWVEGADAKFRRIAALLRGDEPAKPDRYAVIAEEITSAANIVSHGGYYELDIEAADAVLRRHFAPPSVVVEAAEMVQRLSEGATAGTYYASAKAIADFILKGDQ